MSLELIKWARAMFQGVLPWFSYHHRTLMLKGLERTMLQLLVGGGWAGTELCIAHVSRTQVSLSMRHE